MYSGGPVTITECWTRLLKFPMIDCKSFNLTGLYLFVWTISYLNFCSFWSKQLYKQCSLETGWQYRGFHCIFCAEGKSGSFSNHLEILPVVISEESLFSKFGNGKVSSTINFFARNLVVTSKATWIGLRIHFRPFSPNEKGGMIVSIRVSNVLYKSFKVNYCKHFR